MTTNGKAKLKSKLWIEKDNAVIFGLGRIEIFNAIEKTGSMNKAAASLGMSYRAAWGKVKATEERLNLSLVERDKKAGTSLTQDGKNLLKQYILFQEEAYKTLDTLFETHLEEFFEHLNNEQNSTQD